MGLMLFAYIILGLIMLGIIVIGIAIRLGKRKKRETSGFQEKPELDSIFKKANSVYVQIFDPIEDTGRVRYVGGFPAELKVDERINASYIELKVPSNKIRPVMKRVYVDTRDLIPRSDGGWLLQLVRKSRYDVTPTKILLDISPDDTLAMRPVVITDDDELKREEESGRLSPETTSRVRSVLAVYEPMSVDEKRIYMSTLRDLAQLGNTWWENNGLMILGIAGMIIISFFTLALTYSMFQQAVKTGGQIAMSTAREAANVTISAITQWLEHGGIQDVTSGAGTMGGVPVPVVSNTNTSMGGG